MKYLTTITMIFGFFIGFLLGKFGTATIEFRSCDGKVVNATIK